MTKLFTAFIITLTVFITPASNAQSDSARISQIYSNALTSYESFQNLQHLCENIGGRICGSPGADNAVSWLYSLLLQMNFDSVYLQEVMVNSWSRGEKETASFITGYEEKYNVNVAAIGFSVGTGENGVTSNVIEVQNFDELEKLGTENVKGKIVFFNRPANQNFLNTFYAYGDAVNQRSRGASVAAKFGAVGVIVRSVTLINDDFPHTGIMTYDSLYEKIPAVCISTNDANLLSSKLKEDPSLIFSFKTFCNHNVEKPSANVIAEIKGALNPENIIVVSGHLDAWDICEGAHDDGVGIMHALEVIRIFKFLGIKPNNTIRFVAYMDEEVAQRGGRKYAEYVQSKTENHIAALESDVGGFNPLGFTVDASDSVVSKFQKFQNILAPFGCYFITKGYGGVDISFLKKLGIPLIGMVVADQRYFDHQHSANDTFESVNRRELQLGSASFASLVYLIDKYGL